jgi:phosphatidate cytidylyltransferase
MLQRLITGTTLAICAVLAIIFAPLHLFITISTALTLLAAWEWGLLLGFTKYTPRFLYVILIVIMMYIERYVPFKALLVFTFLWWCFAIYLMITYPKTSKLWGTDIWKRAFMGMLVLIPSWIAINHIRMMPQGIAILLFLLLLIWSSDTGAYIAGKRFGKHLLLPLVSPKKTIEGIIGAIVLSLIVAIISCFMLNLTLHQRLDIVMLSIPTALFSMVGDLLESMLKRQVGIKDTGQYLPGHGGLLDRIDSLTAAAPVFLLGLLLFV